MGLEKFALTDRIALVTGGGQGMGEAIALAMAEVGAHVVVADINLETAQKVSKEIEKLGRKALALPVDVTVSSQIKGMVNKIVAEFGRIDILVNNAGGISASLLGAVTAGAANELTEEAWDKVINLNLKSCFLCSKIVAPVMLRQKKGAIINLCSISGLMAYPIAASYGAAKAGIWNFTESLAAELAPNIRVNAVAPGTIETPMVREIIRRDPEMMEKRTKRMLLRRLGKTEEVAYTVVFLASDAASYITGETIIITGGLTTFIGIE